MSTYKVTLCKSTTRLDGKVMRCEKLAGHAGKHQAGGFLSWGPDSAQCGAPHPDPERAERCERPRGHLSEHVGGLVDWPAIPAPAPQFKPGDRVSVKGTVIDSTPGSPYTRLRMPDDDMFSITAEHLTLVAPGRCAALFPGRENEDPPPRCSLDAGHEDLHTDLRGWRWGTIEQRTDDAHAPAEPRCKNLGPHSAPGSMWPAQCWGMAGHIGPHRTPSGEWT